MRNYLLGAVAASAILAAGAAHAADAVEAPPAPPAAAPVEYAPVAGWSGFYAGVFGGYSDGTFDTALGDIDAKGWDGGVFTGYNMQSGNFVYGAEVDLGYSGVDGSANFGGTTVSAEQKLFGSARARLGYAFDPFMVYGTGGIAATQVEAATATDTDKNTHIGYTVGAGAEALVTQNIFARTEYRYTDYKAKDYTLDGTTVSSGFDEHSIRAGIGFKF